MFKYIVHVQRKNVVYDFNISYGRERAIGYNCDKIEVAGDLSNPFKQETAYFNTKEFADIAAKKFAEENPDQEVLVCEVQSIAMSKPSKAVVLVVTEKGVLPA